MDTELLKVLVEAYNTGAWPIFVGALIMFLVGFARGPLEKYAGDERVKAWLPYITVALSVLTAFGGALLAGSAWLPAAGVALSTFLAASAFWKFVGKKVMAWFSTKQKARNKEKKAIEKAKKTGSLNLADLGLNK